MDVMYVGGVTAQDVGCSVKRIPDYVARGNMQRRFAPVTIQLAADSASHDRYQKGSSASPTRRNRDRDSATGIAVTTVGPRISRLAVTVVFAASEIRIRVNVGFLARFILPILLNINLRHMRRVQIEKQI